MTRSQISRLFRRHHGAAARLSRELGCSRTTISRWFRGHVVSARLEAAIRNRAKELLGDVFVRTSGDSDVFVHTSSQARLDQEFKEE